jgi:hypothetical protein
VTPTAPKEELRGRTAVTRLRSLSGSLEHPRGASGVFGAAEPGRHATKDGEAALVQDRTSDRSHESLALERHRVDERATA